ncbi:ArsR/SmtB family transcription factor [Mycobacterium shigaense]|uniref:Putative transcriptional regulator, ArsR family protein n=1 Tax=Mycobacterium shigaense TaxID=722731 RepID=A0A1Z4EPS5_9MYCO|nr:metalloregulator ArsR/SmtB family transcription factor [Mycobacterium shigaense]MEA1121692.1 metalloregulator ArsR/SmtB family transcription factor [Mycobacterium shigaense]PRI15052.1 transcriptional regulator [Mycobacterium shigaense]BAX94886.1 putative transcriptional regulator, ArsR family protein [Mycobacterium shigaense]
MSNQTRVDCRPGLGVAALDDAQAATLATMFKALGDPVRLRLLSQIASHPGGEACVCEISTTLDVSQPTISHHLKLLRSAGLIDCERRGTWVYYWVIPSTLQHLSSALKIDDVVVTTTGCCP